MPVFACAYAYFVHEVAASRSSFRPRLFPRLDCQQPSGSTRLRARWRGSNVSFWPTRCEHSQAQALLVAAGGPVALQPGRTDSALALIVEVGTPQVRCPQPSLSRSNARDASSPRASHAKFQRSEAMVIAVWTKTSTSFTTTRASNRIAARAAESHVPAS